MKNIPRLLPFSKKVLTYAALLPADLPERDWAIIALAHYDVFLKRAALEDLITQKIPWAAWWKKLTLAQQTQMMRNFLSYAYSTHNLEFVGQKLVSLEE